MEDNFSGKTQNRNTTYMDNRPASEYAQSGSQFPYPPSVAPSSELPAVDQASAAAAPAPYTPQAEVRPAPQYTPQPDVRPTGTTANISSSNTPQSDYGLNQPPAAAAARSPAYDYMPRPQYHHAPSTQAGGAAGMAQATSPSITTLGSSDGQSHIDHHTPSNNINNNQNNNMKSDIDVPIDPSIAASSPTYPPPYSPYQPQGHDMTQYQGHPPPPPPQMYARPEWPHGYAQHGHHMPPYTAPATTVSSTTNCSRFSESSLNLSRSTRSSPFPVPSNISVPAVVTRKLNGCTNVDGMAAKRLMAH